EGEVCLDAAFRREPTGLLLEDPDPVVVRVERRVATPDIAGLEHLVREAVLGRAAKRARHQLTAGRSEVQPAGLREERRAGVMFELAPQLPRAAQHRYVGRMLVVRESDDPREPARR